MKRAGVLRAANSKFAKKCHPLTGLRNVGNPLKHDVFAFPGEEAVCKKEYKSYGYSKTSENLVKTMHFQQKSCEQQIYRKISPLRHLVIPLESMDNHWISLCFLRSLRDGTPHGLSRTLPVLGNLMVNRNVRKPLGFLMFLHAG